MSETFEDKKRAYDAELAAARTAGREFAPVWAVDKTWLEILREDEWAAMEGVFSSKPTARRYPFTGDMVFYRAYLDGMVEGLARIVRETKT